MTGQQRWAKEQSISRRCCPVLVSVCWNVLRWTRSVELIGRPLSIACPNNAISCSWNRAQIRGQLSGIRAGGLPGRATEQTGELIVRHTIGLADPLTDAKKLIQETGFMTMDCPIHWNR